MVWLFAITAAVGVLHCHSTLASTVNVNSKASATAIPARSGRRQFLQIRRDNRLLQERKMQDDAPDCQAENQILSDNQLLPRDTNPDIWFLFETSFQKNYSDWYSCDDDGLCDFSKLLAYMQPVCEYLGGQQYAVSGSASCENWNEYDENGELVGANSTAIRDHQYPVCLGPSCDPDFLDQSLDIFEGCDNVAYDAQALDLSVPDVLTDACASDMEKLRRVTPDDPTASSNDTTLIGIGDPSYVYESTPFEDNCMPAGDGMSDNCDFSSTHADLQTLCEAQGGYLYAMADTYNYTTYDRDTGTIVESYSENTALLPICIAASCIGPRYIEELIVPYLTFVLEGSFDEPAEFWFDDDTVLTTQVNITRTANYNFVGFTVISDVPSSTGSSLRADMAWVTTIAYFVVTTAMAIMML